MCTINEGPAALTELNTESVYIALIFVVVFFFISYLLFFFFHVNTRGGVKCAKSADVKMLYGKFQITICSQTFFGRRRRIDGKFVLDLTMSQ